MQKWYLFLAVSLLCAMAGCSADVADQSPVVAEINDYRLTLNEFKAQLSSASRLQGDQKLDKKFIKDFLEERIQTELIIQEAVRLRLDKRKAFIRAIEHYLEATLLRDVLDYKAREIKAEVVVKQEEVRQYYDELSKTRVLPPFEDMEETLTARLVEKKNSDRMAAWISELRKGAKVTINEDILANKL
jgi:hypothetical protein